MSSQTITYVVVTVLCIFLSGCFSAIDTAFSNLNKSRVRSLAEKDNRRAKLTLKLTEDPERLAATVRTVTVAFTVTAAVIGTLLFTSLTHKVGALISVAAVTVALLLFGEFSPTSIAKKRPEGIAMLSAPAVQFLMWVLFPLTFLFIQWKKLFSKLFRSNESEEKMSQEELLMLVDEVEQEGSIDGDEGSLLRNVIEFTDRKAEEILTHRVNLAGFALGASKEEIAQMFAETKFSRLLAYENDIDHIAGVLHQKDFYTADGVTDREIEELLTPALFIPQTEIISDLLRLFQINQSHLAVVVDEYGETLGIVTMEDILEELVGEIWDEHDEVVENFREIGEDTYEVNCEIAPADFASYFDVEIKTECSTLNGWISEQIQKIPENDDIFTYDRLTIKVVEIDAHRATFVNVIAPPKTEENTDVENEKEVV